MRRIQSFRSSVAYLGILLAVLTRFIPHIPNFSPVYGALLFGGAYLSMRSSLLFPLILLGASDFALSRLVYHTRIGWMEFIELAAFAAIPMVGWLLRRRVTITRFALASLAGPTAFYLISNLGVWLGWQAYPKSWAGLIACYIAGIPFYGYSLIGSVVFGAVLFGASELFAARYRQHHSAEAHS